MSMRIVGVDFTSAPSRRKAITVAHGRSDGARVRVDRVDRLTDWPSFEALLSAPGPWVGADSLSLIHISEPTRPY